MFKKFALSIFLLIFIPLVAILSVPNFRQLLLTSGFIKEEIYIAGTGSMYPTFPKGESDSDLIRAQEIVAWPKMRRYPSGINLFGYSLFSYTIQYGDIVEIDNQKTKEITKEKYGEEAGFVKRAIALPADTIELRDGFLYRNGQILDEPYTARARSTYGGDFLPDCQTLTVPKGFLFVLGDNRKASLDSRFALGYVSFLDIHYILPWSEQEEYKKVWRNTQNDAFLAHSTTLDNLEFVKLLNTKRQEKNLKSFKYNSLLTKSSKIRGEAIIDSNDFSSEATKSGITLAHSIKNAGYRNIIFAEVFSRGFYEAEELFDNFLEFPDTKKILFSSEYQDIGISAILGDIENCPVQVVVAHFGGYIPPNYSKEEIDNWASLVSNMEEVLPSWRALREAEGIDQERLRRLISLLETRKSNATKILSKLRSNIWLDEEDKRNLLEDKHITDVIQRLISELNPRQ